MQQQNTSAQISPSESTNFRILNKNSLGTDRRADPQEFSVLPLESLKLYPRTRKNPLSQAKFMHISHSKSPSPERIKSAKQLAFRGDTRRLASEEKARQLEETRMLARQRRLHKADIQKRAQGVVSAGLRAEQGKKFRRSEEQRVLGDAKKFKRIKQKPDQQQMAIREKIMRKIMQDPRQFLSGIAQRPQELLVSQLELGECKGTSDFQPVNSESVVEVQSFKEQK